MEESHSDDGMMPAIDQLMAPNEIKQEIKEEPISDDDLVEFPAIFSGSIDAPLDNSREHGGDDIASVSSNIGVESKVRPECTQKKKKKNPKASRMNKRPMDNRNNQRSVARAGIAKAKKSNKMNPRSNAAKQHQCDQCGYVAKYKSLLEMHLKTHTGEKPFGCSYCPKAFTAKRYLQLHMKMHVDEFPFNCAICLKGFDKKDEKFMHEKGCRIRRYECHLCKQSFGSKKGHLIRHIRTHSGAKPFQCKECSKKFTMEGDLKRHMKTHAGPRSFYCSRCRLGYVLQVDMIAHEQKCRRRLYECYVCGKFIGLGKKHLERHMRTHTGDKPFQCMMCPRNFALKSNLTRHMNRIHDKYY